MMSDESYQNSFSFLVKKLGVAIGLQSSMYVAKLGLLHAHPEPLS